MGSRIHAQGCLLFLAVTITTVFTLTYPPLIEQQPSGNQIPFKVGESFKLLCVASGEPRPTYYWHFNDKLFDPSGKDGRVAIQPGVGTLIFSNPVKKDEGHYQCFAKNQFGISASVRVFLREAVLDSFSSSSDKPKVHRPRVGSSLVLDCVPPESYPAATVIWSLYRQGISQVRLSSRVTIDHDGNLCITNVVKADRQDDKIYACTVSNNFIRKTVLGASQQILPQGEVAQNSAPELIKHTPFDTTVARGDTYKAKCIFSGRPTPRVEWTRSYSSMSRRTRTGSFGMELIIDNIQPEDAGTYECQGINDQTRDPVRRAFKVKVLSPPSWEEKPENVDAGEGDTVEFLCMANGNPLPEYRWFINGTDVSKLPKDPRRIVETNRMKFINLQKDDARVIQCNASNTVGYLWANAYMNVLSEAPKIVTFPEKNLVAAEGTTVTLRCEVKGSPRPLVVWRKGSEQLTGGRFTVLKTGDLKIKQISLVDAGTYYCNASNKFGKDGTVGKLVVRRKTQILTKPLDLMVVRASEAKFTCTATTDPAEIKNLKIKWKKDGQVINYRKAQRMFENYMDNSLTISGTIHLDTGEYTCVATNGLDSEEASAQLIVQDIPDAPVNIKVECMTGNIAMVYWTPSKENFAPILNFIVQYNTTFTPDTWNVVNATVPQNFRKVDIQMSPWGNYTFRVLARNKVGMSPPSEHSKMVCKTEPAAPDKAPDNVFAEGDRPDNMIIYWTPMPKIEQNGPNFHYMINYYINGSNTPHYQRVDDAEKDRLEVPEQLSTYVEYVVEIYAANTQGRSPIKRIVGHSGEDGPLEIPQNIQVDTSTLKPTEAVLVWDEIDKSDERIRGFFKGYRIQFWKTKEGQDAMREVDWIIKDPRRYGQTRMKRQAEVVMTTMSPEPVNMETPTTVQYVLRDLPPYSDITVRILVLNKAYAGPPSLEIKFRTPEGFPSPPADMMVAARGPNFFDLKWEPPLNKNGHLIGYNISYQLITGLNLGRLQYRDPITDPDATEAKLTGLMSERLYRVYLAASTKYGRGEPIFMDLETTSPTKPNAPTFIVSEYGETWTKVMWEPSRYGNPGSVFYAQHRRKGDHHWFHSPDVTHVYNYNISTLDPGITYQFRVVAKNGLDQETASELIDLRTKGTSAAEVNVGAMGWFIGLIVILFAMILMLIGFWFLKKSRDAWFERKEQERAEMDRQSQEDQHAYSHDYARSEDYEFESSKSHYTSSLSDMKHTPSESNEYSDESFGDGAAGGYSGDPRGPVTKKKKVPTATLR